jgi:NTE family protein
MASAALPLLYESQRIGNHSYTDGGQGGWKTVQGNTPITPLVEAGCNLVIVSHLSDGSLWDRHNFLIPQSLKFAHKKRLVGMEQKIY